MPSNWHDFNLNRLVSFVCKIIFWEMLRLYDYQSFYKKCVQLKKVE
jgi:hypothetical protein